MSANNTSVPTLRQISFDDDQLMAIEKDEKIYVAMKPICEVIGLNWSGQYSLIKRDEVLAEGICIIQTPSSGGLQETTCLPLEYLNGWLFKISLSRIENQETKEKVIRYQKECYKVLHDHFMGKEQTVQSTIPKVYEVFNFVDKQVRFKADEKGNPWFVADDVCKALDIMDSRRTLKKSLDGYEKGVDTMYSPDGNRPVIIISESGLYTLIMESNNPQAKSFCKWVTLEVLPSIRKTGTYSTKKVKEEDLVSLSKVAKDLRALISIAKTLGMKGNKAVIFANQGIKKIYGLDCLDLLGATHLFMDTEAIGLINVNGGIH